MRSYPDRADDLGTPYDGPQPAMRVVSLVPSLTESLASVHQERIVGATDWCTHPLELDTTLEARVQGTKNPDRTTIQRLQPDVVVANKEENRELDVRRLRASGVRVWVTDIETVAGAVASLERLFAALGWAAPTWLAEAHRLAAIPPPSVVRRVVVPIWRDPWMVVGARTFTSDLLRRVGWANLYASDGPRPDGERYPRVDLAAIDQRGADAVLLPDEPYPFSPTDGPEAFTTTPTELVSGRRLTWYGPTLPQVLGDPGNAFRRS